MYADLNGKPMRSRDKKLYDNKVDYADNISNEGEVYFQFLNFLPFDVTIKKGEKIGQGLFQNFLLTDSDSAIGERIGGFGSTGN